ncbi:serine/threonine protein kinase [Apiospora arundinis]
MGKDEEGVWLKVFTILLQLGKGSCIGSFWRLGILDSRLPVTPAQLQRLWDEAEAPPEEPIKLTDNFLRLQRQLCATIDGKHWLPEIGTEDDVILPITIKQFIGGSTFKAHIPLECFRTDLNQRHPGISDLEGREVFDVALTIWNKSSDIDERKLAAYKALNVAQNRGFCQDMEQCYGSWRINGATYVLRQWKYSTLENMFEISKEESSFVLTSRDIRRFWMHVLALTRVVSGVKYLEGCALEYYSWHININPSAVFFNSPFKESWRRKWGLGHIETAVIQDWPARKEQIPFTSARGDSVAYGGPELGRPGLEKVTQSSDMWSLGCVISETATWVTLGNEGIVKYRSLRASLSPSGCFHDDWVESDMLLGDPADRISADDLWRKFDTWRRSS